MNPVDVLHHAEKFVPGTISSTPPPNRHPPTGEQWGARGREGEADGPPPDGCLFAHNGVVSTWNEADDVARLK